MTSIAVIFYGANDGDRTQVIGSKMPKITAFLNYSTQIKLTFLSAFKLKIS